MVLRVKNDLFCCFFLFIYVLLFKDMVFKQYLSKILCTAP